MRKNIIIILMAVILAAAFAACSQNKTDDNMVNDGDRSSKPDITGEVLDIQNEKVLRVLVDSESDYVTGQIWVSVTEDTKFVDSNGLEVTPDDITGLFEKGEPAAFLSTGEIMESYPMQARAEIVFVK